MSVIYTGTNSVVDVIQVGATPEFVAITPNGSRALVNDGTGGTLLIDTATDSIIGTLIGWPATNTLPNSNIVVTPNGSHAYVMHQNGSGGLEVGVIDVGARAIGYGVYSPIGYNWEHIALDSQDNALVPNLGNWASPSLGKVSLSGNFALPELVDGWYTDSVAVTPNGSYAYASSSNAGTNVIDLTSYTVIATLPGVGSSQTIGVVVPNGSFVYVPLPGNQTGVIGTSTNAIIATVNGPSGWNWGAATPNGSLVYVVGGSLWAINTASQSVVATIPVSGGFVAVSPNGSRVYVPVSSSNSVAVVDTATQIVIATVPVGTSPSYVAIKP